MERAAILAGGRPLRREMLSIPMGEGGVIPHAPIPTSTGPGGGDEAAIRTALDRNDWNIQRSARALGLSRQALYRRIEKYGIERR